MIGGLATAAASFISSSPEALAEQQNIPVPIKAEDDLPSRKSDTQQPHSSEKMRILNEESKKDLENSAPSWFDQESPEIPRAQANIRWEIMDVINEHLNKDDTAQGNNRMAEFLRALNDPALPIGDLKGVLVDGYYYYLTPEQLQNLRQLAYQSADRVGHVFMGRLIDLYRQKYNKDPNDADLFKMLRSNDREHQQMVADSAAQVKEDFSEMFKNWHSELEMASDKNDPSTLKRKLDVLRKVPIKNEDEPAPLGENENVVTKVENNHLKVE